jgi:hypothetical protein
MFSMNHAHKVFFTIAAIDAANSSGALRGVLSPPEEEQRQENHDRANHENVIGHASRVPR